jgi:hypothetical protein
MELILFHFLCISMSTMYTFILLRAASNPITRKKENYYSFLMAILAARTRYIIKLYVPCSSYSYSGVPISP